MHATATVAHKATGLCVPRCPGLARVAIPTPRATPRQLTLEENVEGPVSIIRAEHRRAQAVLLLHCNRVKILC